MATSTIEIIIRGGFDAIKVTHFRTETLRKGKELQEHIFNAAAAVDADVDASIAVSICLFFTRENRAKSFVEATLTCPVGKIDGPNEGLVGSLLFKPPKKCSEQILADELKMKINC